MLADAIKARIPIVTVTTDDVIHAGEVLQSIAMPLLVKQWDTSTKVLVKGVYWSQDEKLMTMELYNKLQNGYSTLIIINPSKPNNLALDCGILPVPRSMLIDALDWIESDQREKVVTVLKGLSLKASSEVIKLTVARTGGVKPIDVRRTRFSMTGGVQGLIPLETESDHFYLCPPKLSEWLDTNQKFFESPTTPHKLVPRGLMLAGPAGTGKTMAAREVAHTFQIPLYRLDITQALNRYVGESENRVLRSLQLAEQESPCVILLDEVEKIFTHEDDGGTVTRILSSLLWWLSEHQSRVITIMTTNNINKIPPELYRPGRLDAVIEVQKLTLEEAKDFCIGVFTEITGDPVSEDILKYLWQALEYESGKKVLPAGKSGMLAQSEVTEIVCQAIKNHDWIKL